MKLFSVKSYHQTSMQDIADACEMSKGSLYLHFKSKEDLLLNIMQYYFQQTEDQQAMIERESEWSVKEKFARQLEVHLNHFVEFKEFYRLQFGAFKDLEDSEVVDFFHQKNLSGLEWIERSLLNIYGPRLEAYATECVVLFSGMIIAFINAIFAQSVDLNTSVITRYLIKRLDSVVEGLLAEDPAPEPLIPSGLQIFCGRKNNKPIHPLVILRRMKDRLENLNLPDDRREEIVDCLDILERELSEVHPRAAILRGMLLNLKEINELAEDLNEFCDSLKLRLH